MICSNPWFQQNSILQAPLQVPSAAFLCSQPTGFQSYTDLPVGPLHLQTPNQMGKLQPTGLDPNGEDKRVAVCSDFLEV